MRTILPWLLIVFSGLFASPGGPPAPDAGTGAGYAAEGPEPQDYCCNCGLACCKTPYDPGSGEERDCPRG